MAIYTSQEVLNTLEQFQKGREVLNGMSVEIVPEENTVDALLLIRTFNSEKTVEDMVPLVQAMCRQRTIRIWQGNKKLFEMMYDGTASIQSMFAKQPWQLDLLINCCYSIMLKKLTPPLDVLEIPVEESLLEN